MQFVCRVGTPEGQVVERVQEGRDAGSVRLDLERRGFHVFELRPKGLAMLQLPGLGGRRKIGMRSLLLFNQELASLIKAGLPLLQALDMTLERQRDETLREILADVRERVAGGEELSRAFERHDDVLPPLLAPTLRAGERSGELEAVLRRFVRYQKLLLEARKKVVSALIYPTVLVMLSLVLVVVMMVFVVPKFTDFYAGMGAELPLITRVVVTVSLFAQKNFWWGLTLVVVGTVVVSRWRRTALGAATLDGWRLKMPLLGSIFHRMALSEFSRSLATLLAGGIPVVSALSASTRSVGNAYVRQRLESVPDSVREGDSLADSLDRTGVGHEILIDMVRVGEATGSLDVMLGNVSDFLDEEVETGLERTLTLLEPMLLVFMGLIVALLLVSVYLPLYGLLNQVQV